MPLSNQIHIDKALTEISVSYKNEAFIADKVAPMVPVKHDSDKFFVYSKDNLRLEETIRANGSPAREVDWNVSSSSYTLEKHSLRHLVTDDSVENADEALDLKMDAAEVISEKLKLRREASVIDLIHTAANWANTTSLTSTYSWNKATDLSNPIKFVDSATAAILKNTGMRPNICVMDENTFLAAKEHPSIVDRVKYTSSDSVTEAMLAKLFNIPEVHISRSIINSASEGLSDSLSFQMTDCCFIGYVEKAPGLRKPSALYCFNQQSYGYPMTMKQYRDEPREGVFVEGNMKYKAKIVASDCGYLIVNTIQ